MTGYGNVRGGTDTTDATATAGDVRVGKTAYANDQKLTGTFTSDATATAGNILTSKTAYINGQKVTGSMANRGNKTFTPSLEEQTSPSGYYDSVTVNPITKSNTGVTKLDISFSMSASSDIGSDSSTYANVHIIGTVIPNATFYIATDQATINALRMHRNSTISLSWLPAISYTGGGSSGNWELGFIIEPNSDLTIETDYTAINPKHIFLYDSSNLKFLCNDGTGDLFGQNTVKFVPVCTIENNMTEAERNIEYSVASTSSEGIMEVYCNISNINML